MSYKFLAIPNFAKAGINSDLMPWDLPGDYLTEMTNVRINRGKLSPFGGSIEWATLPADLEIGFIMPVGSTTAEFWLLAAKDSIWLYDGANFFDISNPEGYAGVSDRDLWTGCLMSGSPIINNPGSYPEYLINPGSSLTMSDLPWDDSQSWRDKGETCKIMRSHKQFLFALDLEGASIGELEDGVRWSSPADVGLVPETWDPTDDTSTAGLVRLGSSGGRIIDGLSLRDAFVVYREKSIHVFDYVAGQFVFKIRHVSGGVGAIAPDSIIDVTGKHYMISDSDIIMFDGNKITSLLQNKLRKRFASDINPLTYLNSYAVRNDVASEIWFCVPRNGSTYPDLAYIYNWRDDTWAPRDIPEAPFANYGSQSSPLLTWETIGGSWDTVIGNWNQNQASPLDDTIIQVTLPSAPGESGKLLLLDKLVDGVSTKFDTNIERVGFALEGLNNVTTITRVYPHMRGPGAVFIQVGSQDFPGAPVRWKEAIKYTPEVDRKVDVRTTGELHCFRIFGANDNSYWEVSGFDIEYVMAGAR
jgi:hypothetical protein